MKIIYSHDSTVDYSESTQRNPIRWTLLKSVSQDEYVNTTNEFKCKDYFNDFVAFKHTGKRFRMYGMWSDQATFCLDGGLYVLVNNTTPEFAKNVRNVLKPTFKDLWGATVKVTRLKPDELVGRTPILDHGACLLWFSPECLVSTFRISLLSLLIRNCNVDFTVHSYEERIDKNFLTDGSIPYEYYTALKNKEFAFPEQAEHPYYLGPDYEDDGDEKYYIHNNGVVAWAEFSLTANYTDEGLIPWLGADMSDKEAGDDYCEEETEAEWA